MSRPLPAPLAPPPPSEELILALSTETGLPAALCRSWLDGGQVPADALLALRKALLAPLGGIGGLR